MIRFCRICSSDQLSPLWVDYGGCQWHRCAACGSESSETTYAQSNYDTTWAAAHAAHAGGFDGARAQIQSNCSWFQHHAVRKGKDFLDVGCLEGAAMAEMQDLGWSVHGFDVNPACARPGCTTIAPFFAAHLFPRRFDAIFCKDVIEHVPGWRQLLTEMTAALYKDGLLQLQTPTPWHENHGNPYQSPHYHLFSKIALENVVRGLGYAVVDRRDWDMGQALMLRLVDKPFD